MLKSRGTLAVYELRHIHEQLLKYTDEYMWNNKTCRKSMEVTEQ